VASANGATLADAVSAAAVALAPSVHDPSAGRLELDVSTAVDGVGVDHDTEVGLPAAGLEGVFATRTSGASAAVLPAEIAEQGMFHAENPVRLDHDRIAHLLSRRARVDEVDLGTMRAYRYRAAAFVESPDHARALPVFRGMVEGSPDVTPEVLLTAVRSGAEYLSRVIDDKGRYVYLYQPATDHDDGSYGWLRHAGTTYAMFEAYGELGSPAILSKGERALAYLEAHLKDDPTSQGKYVIDTDDEEQQKVGGAGLALLAFTKHAAVTGHRDKLDTMRALARFIISRQYEDGRYKANVDVPSEPGKKPKKEPVYYVGEAVLGLMRLYAIDPQPSYLDSARRAADWVVKVRDAIVSEDNQEHDHWISYAFNDLYRVTHDEAYVEHAYKIARAILRRLHRESDAPARDWAGTFYEGQTTPGSTRVEAFDADMALSRFAGKPDAWLMGPATLVARSMLRQQFTDDNDYFLPNPGKARGGVRESLYVQDVRIDYVQHAMSAWLHLALLMRDPAYGKTGVPSQDAVR
jgi:mannose/cellobiose epimerase-like protein (N-acyl-D-glucosamine 2-epimerase family)